MSAASGPEIIVDLWRLRCTVALRMAPDRVAVLDEFSLDPAAPEFGISRIFLLPSASTRDAN